MFLQRFFDVVDHGVGAVARFDLVLRLAVVGRVRLGVFGHLLDFVFGQTGGGGDGDLPLVVGGLVFRHHVEDTVGVDVERYFHLRYAARGRRKALQREDTERTVVSCHGAFALENLDFH